jgi:hypothetical protein
MGRLSIVAALLLLCSAGAMAQGIQGVPPASSSPVQVGVGFTFLRFYEAPGLTQNSAGLDGSFVDYNFRDYGAVEADASDAFGTENGQNTQVGFAGGGYRFRTTHFKTFQPWIHALLGVAVISPKAYGSDAALGYKLGGGLDYKPSHGRIGFRASVDMFGGNFFKTYQLNPQVSAGVYFTLGKQ